ncbi:MAG TPA: hypothetical protein VKE74_35890, partial [Gemmataceae bacterium]|nr:hypothetical protein [Gemmataceae bacterium]
FPAVFDGQNWVEGEPAVAIVLACTGDSPDLIPPEALPVEPKKGKGKPGGKGAKPGGFNYKVPPGGGDVFAAYNATVTLDVVVGWHEADGHKVTKREQGRVEFLRAGKAGSGQSFNVKDVDGIPITYNFSTNTGMPDGKGLTPAQVRCYRESGSCDAAAMNRFAAVLRSEMGWVKDDPQQNESTPGSTPPPPSGADPSAPPGDDPLAGEKFKDTDLANAKRFVFDNGRDCLFVADWNRWCAWDGRRWAVDRTGSIVAGLAHKTLRKMADAALEKVIAAASMMKGAACEEEEARAEKEKAAADRELAWAKKSQDARRVSAMLEMARPYLL